jgi:hypothetical protein
MTCSSRLGETCHSSIGIADAGQEEKNMFVISDTRACGHFV